MDIFSALGDLLNPNKGRGKKDDHIHKGPFVTLDEVVREQKRRMEEARRSNPKPKYHPGKGTYYGDKIYGMEPGDWKQTKPPVSRKTIDWNKGQWKWQYVPDDVLISDGRYTDGKDEIRISVPGLFEVTWPFSMRIDGLPVFNFNKLDREQHRSLIKWFLDNRIIPMPVEELI